MLKAVKVACAPLLARRYVSSVPDLCTTLQPMSVKGKALLKHYVRESVPRFDADIFFGKQFGDFKTLREMTDIVRARREVGALLVDDSASPVVFAKIAHSVLVNCLEGKDHCFCVPRGQMLTGSPLEPLFEEALCKVFSTARRALHNRRSNSSGFALAGAKGTGKSSLTRLVALLSGLLIPNFQSAFINLASCPHVRIDELLLEVALSAGIANVTSSTAFSQIIGSFTQSRCAVGLFLDDLPVLYTEQNDQWTRVHSLLDSSEATFILATGSAGLLPAMIRRGGQDIPLLKALVKEPLISLNDTKLQAKIVPLFTKPEQYMAFLKQRPSFCQGMRRRCSNDDEFVRYLHCVSGGVYRRMLEIDEYPEKFGFLYWKHLYPADGTLLKAVYDELVKPVTTGDDEVDLFSMPFISEERLQEVVKAHYNDGAGREDLQKVIQEFVDKGHLHIGEKGGSTAFTFTVPVNFVLALYVSCGLGDSVELKMPMKAAENLQLIKFDQYLVGRVGELGPPERHSHLYREYCKNKGSIL
jgi:hypothetical protein